MRLLPALVLGLAFATGGAIAACSSTESASAPAAAPEAGPADDEGGVDDAGIAYPAAHAALPQVVTLDGPVLADPKIVPIFFPGFTFRNELLDFTGKLGKSAYWTAVSKEYGVNALTLLGAVDIPDAPETTLTDADIQAWVIARFDGTHPEFGTTPVDGAIYTLFFPATTTIYLGAAPTDAGVPEAGVDAGRGPRTQATCKSVGGYHDNVKVKGVKVAYAVIPQCPTFGPLKGLDVVTGTPSHEWVEAATDPFPASAPAYAMVDDDHLAWTFALGAGEVGDMCAQYDSSFYKDPEIGYTVQRSWSNAAAKAGTDPCVPTPAGAPAYFNSSPVLKDDVNLTSGITKGVIIPVGQSKTIALDLFSSGPTTGPWTVSVGGPGGSMTPSLMFALDKTEGMNGDTINLTITSVSAVTSRQGATTFIVTSTLGSEKRYWAGVVGN